MLQVPIFDGLSFDPFLLLDDVAADLYWFCAGHLSVLSPRQEIDEMPASHERAKLSQSTAHHRRLIQP